MHTTCSAEQKERMASGAWGQGGWGGQRRWGGSLERSRQTQGAATGRHGPGGLCWC